MLRLLHVRSRTIFGAPTTGEMERVDEQEASPSPARGLRLGLRRRRSRASPAAGAGRSSPTATRRTPTPHLAWWIVALGFMVAEVCVVHICSSAAARTPSRSAMCRSSSGWCSRPVMPCLLAALLGTGVVWAFQQAPARPSSSPSTLRSSPWRLSFVAGLILRALSPPAERRSIPRRGAPGTPRRWSAGALTILSIAGAIAISEGGLKLSEPHADVRDERGRDADEHQPLAIAAALVVTTDARAVPGAPRACADGLRRVSRVHLRAPAPRTAGVPLRGQPHAVAAHRRSPKRSKGCWRARWRRSAPGVRRGHCCSVPTGRARHGRCTARAASTSRWR